MRIDRWLCAARIYKSRTLATEACAGGHVKLNGATSPASKLVRLGDRVEAVAPRGKVVLVVKALAEKRLGAGPARELYEDHSPPPPPPEQRPFMPRERGLGRPTKADRRATMRLRGR